MASSKPSTGTTEKKPRKARAKQINAYVATVGGESRIVMAHTQADAQKAVVQIRPASHADLIQAGKESWTQVNATPAEAGAPGSLIA